MLQTVYTDREVKSFIILSHFHSGRPSRPTTVLSVALYTPRRTSSADVYINKSTSATTNTVSADARLRLYKYMAVLYC